MFFYYPYNKGKFGSSYPPDEPKPVKTKIGNALWNELKVHCFWEMKQNITVTTGNDDKLLHVSLHCKEILLQKIKYTL